MPVSNQIVLQALIKDCSRTDSFFKGVDWVGVVGNYTTHFDSASSEKGCCQSCFDHGEDPGCAGWLFTPNNKFTPCTKIMIHEEHDGKDDKCPMGYSEFSYSGDGKGTAGIGPCSNSIS